MAALLSCEVNKIRSTFLADLGSSYTELTQPNIRKRRIKPFLVITDCPDFMPFLGSIPTFTEVSSVFRHIKEIHVKKNDKCESVCL